MATPNPPMHLRLPPELQARLDTLAAAMPGLPRSQLLRLLLTTALAGSLEEQIERVTRSMLSADVSLPKTGLKGRSKLNAHGN